MSALLAATFIAFGVWALRPDDPDEGRELDRFGPFLTTRGRRHLLRVRGGVARRHVSADLTLPGAPALSRRRSGGALALPGWRGRARRAASPPRAAPTRRGRASARSRTGRCAGA